MHLTNPVLWTSEEKVLYDMMKASGEEWKVLETGVGKVLNGLWIKSEIAEGLECTSVNTAETINEL